MNSLNNINKEENILLFSSFNFKNLLINKLKLINRRDYNDRN